MREIFRIAESKKKKLRDVISVVNVRKINLAVDTFSASLVFLFYLYKNNNFTHINTHAHTKCSRASYDNSLPYDAKCAYWDFAAILARALHDGKSIVMFIPHSCGCRGAVAVFLFDD